MTSYRLMVKRSKGGRTWWKADTMSTAIREIQDASAAECNAQYPDLTFCVMSVEEAEKYNYAPADVVAHWS